MKNKVLKISYHDIYFFLVLLLVFTLPISQFLSSRLSILVCFSAFFLREYNNWVKICFRNSWDVFLYFLVLVTGLFYSQDFYSGLKVIESNLSFLAIPLIFARLYNYPENAFRNLVSAFIIGLILACLICLGNAIIMYHLTGDITHFFFYGLTKIIDYQPTYFAYYLIFGIAYCLFMLFYKRSKGVNNPVGLIFTVSLFFSVLMLTGGQTAFISILLIFSFFILKFLTETKDVRKLVVMYMVSAMLIGMFLVRLVGMDDRLMNLTDSWDRLVLWESGIAASTNSLLGVGTGDFRQALNKHYVQNNLHTFAKENFNSHNQFIQLFFTNGLLGIISLVLLLGRPIYTSAANGNMMELLLTFPFLIYGVTEVFLGRYQGIVFFVMVHQICINQSRLDRQLVTYSDRFDFILKKTK